MVCFVIRYLFNFFFFFFSRHKAIACVKMHFTRANHSDRYHCDAEAMQRTVFNLLFSIQSIDVFVIVSAVVLSI